MLSQRFHALTEFKVYRFVQDNNTRLEIVHTFCYLGFDVKPSGVVSGDINTLYEKAKKTMRPLLGAICTSYRMVQSATWEIFFEFFLLPSYFTSRRRVKYRKQKEREKYFHIARFYHAITGLSFSVKISVITNATP